MFDEIAVRQTLHAHTPERPPAPRRKLKLT